MIRKLRHKFILINMAFVATILLIVLGIFCSANVMRLRGMTQMAIMQALDRERFDSKREAGKMDPERRGHDRFQVLVPVFVLHLGEDGHSVENIVTDGITVSEEQASELAGLVLSSPETEGNLNDYSLRYRKDNSFNGVRIAFADTSFESGSMRSLMVNCTLLFLAALLLFFFLSLFLSRWALQPVEQAWAQQNQFIADASHELKTPLTVILANLEILSAHKDSTIREQGKWLSNTKEEAVRMRQLVEELLFLAKSDAQAFPGDNADFTEIDYSDLVLNCTLLFESVAFEQKVTLESHITPDIHIRGNDGQLKRMAAILLDNACKYAGPHGSASITLEKSQHDAVLTVSNTGQPIPPEAQKHVFERFYRADESRARKEGGYGLGLPIAQTIADRHKGKISLASDAGRGTVFTVQLPLEG